MVISIGSVFLHACSNSGEGVNPGLVDIPLVYTKRTIPVDEDGVPVQYDVSDPLLFSGGGDLYIRTATSSSAAEKNISRSITNGLGDVKDVNASYDGESVIFSLRLADPDPGDAVIPKWGIYEYDVENDSLRRIIVLDDVADDGNDIAPAYLPDGRIVFSSDRQIGARGMLSDESAIGVSKPQFSAVGEDNGIKALVLHVMDADGNNMHQISSNQSHDLDPVVMPNGRILFSRWEHAGGNNSINLYTVNPDGSDLQIYYGDHASSHRDANNDVVQLTKPRVMQDGRILVLARPFTDTFAGGDLWLIDGANYVDINQPIFANQNILSGPAQTKATLTNVSNHPVTQPGSSTAGRYGAAFPLLDGSNRLIVSKGVCQLTTDDINDPAVVVQLRPCIEPYLSNPAAIEMPSAYGLWLYDLSNNTERPLLVAVTGYILTDVVVLQKHNRQTIIADPVLVGVDANLAAQNVGVLNIRSVYDMGNGTFTCAFSTVSCVQTSLQILSDLTVSADQRPARFLRLIKPVGIPDSNDTELTNPPDLDNDAFGRNRSLGMREIIGYTMIEPDGSVKVKVPANVAFGIEVLDKSGRRIGPRHDNWLQLRAGQTLTCNGCHTVPALPLPHGRTNAEAPSINPGMPSDAYAIPNSQIPNTALPYLGNFMETLAEVRTRTNPLALDPSMDIKFSDNWKNLSLDASFRYTYASYPATAIYPIAPGLTTASFPVPASSPCHAIWVYNCRAVINYEEHIQPVWAVNRGVNTCTTCHNTKDAVNADQVPAGQLDLTGGDSDEEPNHVESYRDLLFNDNNQILAGGVLVDETTPVLVPVLDANGNQVIINGVPQFVTVFEAVENPNGPAMVSNGARASYFMEKMNNTELDAGRALSGTSSHVGFLTAEELRLIAEWLDLGGQYYNNPFDLTAPQN